MIFKKKDDNIIYGSEPDFTECFQLVILRWLPCFLVWILLPFWLNMVKKDREIKVKITWFTIVKTVYRIYFFIIKN